MTDLHVMCKLECLFDYCRFNYDICTTTEIQYLEKFTVGFVARKTRRREIEDFTASHVIVEISE